MSEKEFCLCGRTLLIGTVGNFDSDIYRVIIDYQTIPFNCDIHGEIVARAVNCSPNEMQQF